MKLSLSKLSLTAAAFFTLSSIAGCAADANDDDATDEVVGETNESDLTITPTRQAQLDALRARVTSDFAHPASLAGKKLVFVVHSYHADAAHAVIFARIQKRDIATGKDAELTSADYKGSAFEPAIKFGAFDGPEAMTVLEKSGSKWVVAKHGHQEAYAVGPTDVAFEPWPRWFGLPKSWFGL